MHATSSTPSHSHARTGVAQKRQLSFKHLTDIGKDLDKVEAAARAGRLTQLGNWPPGAILDHLARAMHGSIDGVPDLKVPMFLKVVGPLVKRQVLMKPLGKGLKLTPKDEALVWNRAASFDEGLKALRGALARAESSKNQMRVRHPVFGAMTPEDWGLFHMRHAELHLRHIGID